MYGLSHAELISSSIREDMTLESITEGISLMASRMREDNADVGWLGTDLLKQMFQPGTRGTLFMADVEATEIKERIAMKADERLKRYAVRQSDALTAVAAVTTSNTPSVQRYMTTRRHHLIDCAHAPLHTTREFVWDAHIDPPGAKPPPYFVNAWGISTLNQLLYSDASLADQSLEAILKWLGNPIGIVQSTERLPGLQTFATTHIATSDRSTMYNYWQYHDGDPNISTDDAACNRLTAWFVLRKVAVTKGEATAQSLPSAPVAVAPSQPDDAVAAPSTAVRDVAVALAAGKQPTNDQIRSAAMAAAGLSLPEVPKVQSRPPRSVSPPPPPPIPSRHTKPTPLPPPRPTREDVKHGNPVSPKPSPDVKYPVPEAAAARVVERELTLNEKIAYAQALFAGLRAVKPASAAAAAELKEISVWQLCPYLTIDGDAPDVRTKEPYRQYRVGRILTTEKNTITTVEAFRKAVFPRTLTWYTPLQQLPTLEVVLDMDQLCDASPENSIVW